MIHKGDEFFYVRPNPYPEHIQVAMQYLNMNRDSHPEVINGFLKSVDLPPGNPYCAAFVSYCLSKSCVIYPATRSGLARHFLTRDSISATKVVRTNKQLPVGSIIGWKRGNTIFGHLGFTLYWIGNNGSTIEGNTSPGQAGSQAAGGGIYIRNRTILPAASLRISWFTLVESASC
ncbi:MAG: hypothetical protein LAT67_05170 [Balneolales bacterium]|nr:hypothetical protein [Balneolales bacterium]